MAQAPRAETDRTGPQALTSTTLRKRIEPDVRLDARIARCPDATLTTTMTAYLDAYSVGIRAPEVTLHNGWPLSCGRAKAYHDSCRSIPPARRKPAAVSFSGLLDGQRV